MFDPALCRPVVLLGPNVCGSMCHLRKNVWIRLSLGLNSQLRKCQGTQRGECFDESHLFPPNNQKDCPLNSLNPFSHTNAYPTLPPPLRPTHLPVQLIASTVNPLPETHTATPPGAHVISEVLYHVQNYR
jgi:hypothetical protein